MFDSLYDDPPHRLALYRTTTAEDSAGGRQVVEELVQDDIKVSFARYGAALRSQFDQTQMVVPGRIGVSTELLDEIPQRGWTGKVTHTYTGQVQQVIFSGAGGGVTVGEEYGGIASLTHFSVEVLL